MTEDAAVTDETAPPPPPAGPAAAPGAVAPSLPVPPSVEPNKGMGTARWGMAAFLLSEVAFFTTLIVTYLAYLGEDTVPPTPATALALVTPLSPQPGSPLVPALVIWTTACLLSSSLTIHLAEGALRRGRASAFRGLWALTIALGAVFLAGTAYEWRGLIKEHHLTISTNLFGTTYYTLVGFHGLHVTIGLVALTVVLGLALRGLLTEGHAVGVEMVSWYWHFVDVVWVAVFTIVYVIGR